jgi:hypothetical protein
LALLCLLALPLGGCWGPLFIATTGAAVTSLTITGRAPADIVVSAVTGRDCSIARIDRHLPYCSDAPSLPDPPPACTRSLGSVDCWPAVPAGYRGVADQPPHRLEPGPRWHGLW